ncbi:murein L,D-transpeptidase [Rubellimicrobium sp. CFH 75288]|uniref:L,D-transpeptidase family protein n=1 Tax=Rubellimicrobium sp. CFH 75288 TaxID=2697034 RepID=UPI0014137441|nr:L,D-transpeptidase family protein [Rubellimicrobium sp. CFH 75288]NAZ36992.1 L,D-transpeptidase family protein [Rubellimicrobium sp. CFH 75288]
MTTFSRRSLLAVLSAAAAASTLPAASASALSVVTGFRQGVAEGASRDEVLAAFYRERDFAGLWAGSGEAERARRNALLAAMTDAPAHGLPRRRHDPEALLRVLRAARTPYEQGLAEVDLSRAFLRLVRDLGSGVLVPSQAEPHVKRQPLAADPLTLLTVFPLEEPVGFLRSLAPASAEYARLMRAKLDLEAAIRAGGWGEAPGSGRLEPGQTGEPVVRLRDRLIAMGRLEPTVSARYDATLADAVARFQEAHGLNPDGVAGEGTLREMGVTPQERLRAVLVAMERERWNAAPRGSRHIWVNLPDLHAEIVDDDAVTFRTRAVIGALDPAMQTPEFSDMMEYMVINPSWYVPRSIIVRDYLPQLRRNRNAVSHLRITDASGRLIDRSRVNFSNYSASSFPYAMHQPPGPSNALGTVKFMFPNVWNIYLHDTPAKDLFAREQRAYSNGCIRLQDPAGFAHALLARQTDNPEEFFATRLRSGAETRVNLEEPVPVHLEYRTAFTDVRGGLQFRRDVYGRDGRLWQALEERGVEAGAAEG